MDQRVIISLCGRKRSGKESAYRALLPYVKRPEEFQFATPLKKFCIEVLGLTHDQCYGPSEARESATKYFWRDINPEIMKKYGKNPDNAMTARDVLQVFGTDLMRNQFYEGIWAEGGVRAAIQSTATTGVFTDCRFSDEVKACRSSVNNSDFRSSVIVRLYRETGLFDEHQSETSLDHLDIASGQRKLYTFALSAAGGMEACRQALYEKGYQPCTETMWKRRPELKQDPGFDYLVDNNYTLETLRNNMTTILKLEGLYCEPTLS
jgi:hypothetical protein